MSYRYIHMYRQADRQPVIILYLCPVVGHHFLPQTWLKSEG